MARCCVVCLRLGRVSGGGACVLVHVMLVLLRSLSSLLERNTDGVPVLMLVLAAGQCMHVCWLLSFLSRCAALACMTQ